MHRLFSDLSNVINCVDDFLIYGRTKDEHDHRLRDFLERCRTVGLKLNPGKLQFAKSSVRFLGHTINEQGVSILDERVKAIRHIKPPSSPTETRRFLGIINYLQKFIPSAANRTAPLRALTRVDPSTFRWGDEQQCAFNDLKGALETAPVLSHIDPNKQLTISTDSSSFGMGCVLLQDGKPIAFASASLTPTQQRYAQLEKELLAVVFSCEQFRFYILGVTVKIESDHRPLESIVKKDTSTLSPRLQKMMLRLLRFSFSLKYVPGKHMYIADALSRSPSNTHFETPDMENSGELVLCAVVLSSDRRNRMTESSQADHGVSIASKLTLAGWPAHKHQVPVEARKFWQYRNDLRVQEGLLYREKRLVIPSSETASLIATLHAAHQGEERMLRQARNAVFWPGMTADIRQSVENCSQCQLYQRANPKETLRPSVAPPYPWHTVGADFMHLRHKTFIVIVDYFSNDILVKKMHLTTASSVIAVFKELILQHGIPAKLVSDNGPPFGSADFGIFCKSWGIEQQPISPGHSQGNGQIERTIQTIKATMSKALDSGSCLTEALLTLRTTPAEDGVSPSYLSNGRHIRTKLPMDDKLLTTEPAPKWSVRRDLLHDRAGLAQRYFDQHAKDLPGLTEQQKVLVRKGTRQWEEGVVLRVLANPRSYQVRTSSGTVLIRNRREIRRDKRRTLGTHQQQPSPAIEAPQTVIMHGSIRSATTAGTNSNAQATPAHSQPTQQAHNTRARSSRIPVPNPRYFGASYYN